MKGPLGNSQPGPAIFSLRRDVESEPERCVLFASHSLLVLCVCVGGGDINSFIHSFIHSFVPHVPSLCGAVLGPEDTG